MHFPHEFDQSSKSKTPVSTWALFILLIHFFLKLNQISFSKLHFALYLGTRPEWVNRKTIRLDHERKVYGTTHYPFIFPLALSRAYAHLERMQILDKKVLFRCKIDVFVNNMSDRYRLGGAMFLLSIFVVDAHFCFASLNVTLMWLHFNLLRHVE